ncbi:MAG: transcription-repair coupling factor, partial [Clostridiales bacterium]|nr:transcription-repair coupling factor [Clostridiales bacterium]
MSCFSEILSTSAGIRSVAGSVGRGALPLGVLGLSPLSKVHFVNTLCGLCDRKALVVLPDEAQATRFCEDFNAFNGTRGGAYLYPARDFAFRPAEGQSREFEHVRLRALSKVLSGDFSVIACSAEAASQMTLPPGELKSRTFTIHSGDELSPEKIVSRLLAAGYVRADLVEGEGQFAQRGGILDFFPPESEQPVRVELWGDTVDTMGTFEVDTQRRTKELKTVRVTPATEILFDSDEALSEKIRAHTLSLKGKGSVKAKQSLEADLQRLESGLRVPCVDRYLPIAYGESATIFDYFDGGMLFVCESSAVRERVNAAYSLLNEEIKYLFEDGVLAKGLDKYALSFAEMSGVYEKLGAMYLDNFARGSFDTPVKDLVTINANQLTPWDGTLSVLLDDIRPVLSRDCVCAVAAGSEKAAKNLAQTLEDEGVPAIYFSLPPAEFVKGRVNVLAGTFSAGVYYPNEKFMLVSFGGVTGKGS